MSAKQKIALLGLCLAVSGLVFLNAWQGFRYHTLSREVAELEKEQKDLLEKNREAIAQIAHEQSPQVVEQKAGTDVEPLDPAHVTRVPVATPRKAPEGTDEAEGTSGGSGGGR